jgi:hypothetical protein
MHRLVALAVPALAVACALPATAAPVTTGRIAVVRFQLQPSPQVQLDVELSAIASDAGNRLEVSVQQCDGASCGPTSYYAGALPAGEIRIDAKNASGTFRGRVAGRLLALDWTPVPPGTVVLQGMHGGGTNGDMAFTVSRTDPAAAQVVLDGAGCRGSGSVGDEVRVEAPEGSSGDSQPLRRLWLPSAAPICTG